MKREEVSSFFPRTSNLLRFQSEIAALRHPERERGTWPGGRRAKRRDNGTGAAITQADAAEMIRAGRVDGGHIAEKRLDRHDLCLDAAKPLFGVFSALF